MNTINPALGNHAKWAQEQNAKQPRREELFNIVRDPTDWKAPIAAFIKYAWNIKPEELNDAIIHFTGTEATFIHETYGYTVRVDGYRKGPCGP